MPPGRWPDPNGTRSWLDLQQPERPRRSEQTLSVTKTHMEAGTACAAASVWVPLARPRVVVPLRRMHHRGASDVGADTGNTEQGR
jgi:hypothetical protein